MLIDSIRDKSEWNICISSPRDDIRISWENEIIQWELGFDVKLICSASLKNIDSNLDLLVIDEIQMLSPGQINYIIKKKPKRLLGLTGTLDLSTQINLKRRLGLDIIYSYSIEQAIEDSIISNFEVNIILCNFDNEVIDIPSGIKKNPILTTEQGHSDFLHKQYNKFWTLSQQDYTFSSVKEYYARIRKNFIYTSKSKLEIAKRIIDKFDRCMIFSGGIEQARYLSEYTHHSKNKKDNNLLKFQEEEINKLGVVGCGILGITVPNLKIGVIHQLQSNSEMSIQKILRMCNLEDDRVAKIYITCYDNSVDLQWLEQALNGINKNRINWIKQDDLNEII